MVKSGLRGSQSPTDSVPSYIFYGGIQEASRSVPQENINNNSLDGKYEEMHTVLNTNII